jgi:bifunctional UDP-N-acetylglucosamine pyrophosphorylase/glucosamine-1-phosphate N-acetyltransferase
MPSDGLLFVILGAGKGTRMKSDIPKVLHRIAGRSMVGHVLSIAGASSGAETPKIAVVVGPGHEAVRDEARRLAPSAQIFTQEMQLGTADAVKAALPAIENHSGDVIVLFADTPLFQPQTIAAVRAALQSGRDLVVVGFEAADPTGYGRLITDAAGQLVAIREQKDASIEEQAIRLCNAGVMGVRGARLTSLLAQIGNDNANREYYLTDAVGAARAAGLSSAIIVCPEDEVLGVNSRDQLATAEAIWQARRRHVAMREGATLIAPETVWFAHDTRIGRDVVIEPNVFFGPGVTIGDGVEIRANCHIEGATVATGARVGPFARLRPGADLGTDVHIGNFVEVKNVVLDAGAKANHLAYLGDGHVGTDANIGAGTIFCNYDGFFKHRTEVGARAFIGSNSALVAPVKIGEGAFVGSGSVITKNVAPDALAVERSTQEERPGWAAKFRSMMKRRKDQAGR